MQEKFILTRRRYKQGGDGQPKVRINADAYDILTAWASESGQPLSQLASKAIKYANEHLRFIDE